MGPAMQAYSIVGCCAPCVYAVLPESASSTLDVCTYSSAGFAFFLLRMLVVISCLLLSLALWSLPSIANPAGSVHSIEAGFTGRKDVG